MGSRTAAVGIETPNGCVVWPLTEQAAEAYGRIAADLRRAGRPIGKIDMLIAAIALSLGKTTVVSADSDLTAVPGLTVENWATT
jgi:tRNA(fMet)-specific endonuclease VapC